MGEHDRQLADRGHGVTADDLVKEPDVAKAMPHRAAPGSSKVGNPWIDRGAVCDGQPAGTAGCLYEDNQRLRLIMLIQHRITAAATNLKIAAQDLRIAELMKKEDDLPWVLSLALDLAGAHIAVTVGQTLKALRAAGAARLSELSLHAGLRGEYSSTSWTSRAEHALGFINDKAIDGAIHNGFEIGKKPVQSGLTSDLNADDVTAQQAAVSFLDELRDTSDVAFGAFAQQAFSIGSDVELLAIYEGMDPAFHKVGVYKAALSAKLKRFEASGVRQIGRQGAIQGAAGGTIARHTRVVLVRDWQGNTTPWYQTQDGAPTLSSTAHCDPNATAGFHSVGFADAACSFGPTWAREMKLSAPVPMEFRAIAVARSEQIWGATQTIEDPFITQMATYGVGPQPKGAVHPVAGADLPAGSIFARQPVSSLAPTAGGLPANSIFAPVSAPMPDDMAISSAADMLTTLPGGVP